MFPTYIVQWFFKGQWQEIGWRASTPESLDDLKEHGQKLKNGMPGYNYRLMVMSVKPDVAWEFVSEFIAEEET